MHCFEDLGFFCIDNLPPQLLLPFTNLLYGSSGLPQHVALGMDIRGGEFFEEFFSSLSFLEREKIRYQILFLEADPKVIVARYKEARRRHPLSSRGSIGKAIQKEQVVLKDVKERAHQIVDTSSLTVWDLKKKISALFLKGDSTRISIQLISFGFKFGIPLDADVVMDVRFLPNPNYDKKLRHLTGKDRAAKSYVLSSPVTEEFLRRLTHLLTYLIPHNVDEGKGSMVIAIGCTGGKHRSVVVVEELQKRLRKSCRVSLTHRDIERK